MDDISLGVLIAILFFLLVLSAFFSGSETALMTLNRYRLRHLSEDGHPGARRAEQLLKRPDRLIGLILLGNNFVNILASSLATIIALRLGGEGAIAIAAGLLTLIILIFAEVAPKTLAALHPERVAFPASWVYVPLLRLLYPVVFLVNLLANSILDLLKVRSDEKGNRLTREELRTVVNEAGAMIPKKHKKMLLNLLDLEKATVEDIMIPRSEVDGIDLEESLDKILDKIRKTPFTRMLAYRKNIDHVAGFIHSRKMMYAALDGEITKETINDLVRPPYYIPEGTSLNRQLLNFQKERRRIGVVVDEYGDVLGLVTIGDLLEEIVGEFTTTPSDSISDLKQLEDGSYLVNGSINLRELMRNTGWDMPTHGPKTLNGLIVEHLENLPEPGTSIRIAGYPMEIVQTHENMVKVVRVWPANRMEDKGD